MSRPTKSTARKTAKKAAKEKNQRGLNVRQEKFAELVAAGVPATQAYRQAGYTNAGTTAEKNASRLREKEGVAARIAELRKPQTAAATMTKEEKLAFLAAIIRTPIDQIGPDSPLCQEYTEDCISGGRAGKLKRGVAPSGNETVTPLVFRIKTKMCDKLRALELHSKLVGDFEPEKIEVEAGSKTLASIKERAANVSSVLNAFANERARGLALPVNQSAS